jgi:multiple sugar transport system substrate-binding protein
VLGGTGIALSTNCSNVNAAFDYACFITDHKTQMGLYLNAGGQPSRREAWDDPSADRLCGGFFSGTRTTQEEAFIRPRYSGYAPLQTRGGNVLQEVLRDGRDTEAVLEKLDALYRESRQAGSPLFQGN